MLLRNALDSIRRDRQRDRQDFAKFSALITTPGNLATGLQLPANCTMFASTDAILGATTALIEISGRTLYAHAGAANHINAYDGVECGRTIIKAVGAPGTVSVYLADGFGTPVLFAQG